MTSVTHKFKDESTSELPRDGFFSPLCISIKTYQELLYSENYMSRSINDSFAGGSQRMFTKVNPIDKQRTDLAN